MHDIIIQRQEDHPGNPGWWRYSRPRLIQVAEPPEISESVRWSYGTAAEAAEAQRQWDEQNPRG